MPWRQLLHEAGFQWDVAVVPAVNLAAALLRIAAKRKDEIRVDRGEPSLNPPRDALELAVQAVLRPAGAMEPSEYYARARVEQLCEVLDSSPLRPGIAALLSAEVVDACAGHAFIDFFRSRSGQRLMPGDPFPVVAFPCDRLLANEQERIIDLLGKRTSDPRHRLDPVDRINHLRLAPPEIADLCIRVRWAEPWLETIRSITRFCIGVTNDERIEQDFTWREYRLHDHSYFYGVNPKDSERQKLRILAILEEAVAKRANVVVLPELSLSHALLSELKCCDAFAGIPLFIAGSYHAPTEAGHPGRNICEVYAHGELIYSHEKFSDFHYRSGTSRSHEHLQRADGTAGFDLLLSSGCSAVVVICKDLFGTKSLIQHLAPTLLLIPAMSEDTADFQMTAQAQAHDPQGLTLVACSGPKLNAIFGRPNRDEPVFIGRHPAASSVILGLSGLVRVINHK